MGLWLSRLDQGQTPDGQSVPRQSTGTTTLPPAEAFRQSLIIQHTPKIAAPTEKGLALSDAARLYLASRRFFPGKRVRTKKPKLTKVFLSDALKEAIDHCQ